MSGSAETTWGLVPLHDWQRRYPPAFCENSDHLAPAGVDHVRQSEERPMDCGSIATDLGQAGARSHRPHDSRTSANPERALRGSRVPELPMTEKHGYGCVLLCASSLAAFPDS